MLAWNLSNPISAAPYQAPVTQSAALGSSTATDGEFTTILRHRRDTQGGNSRCQQGHRVGTGGGRDPEFRSRGGQTLSIRPRWGIQGLPLTRALLKQRLDAAGSSLTSGVLR